MQSNSTQPKISAFNKFFAWCAGVHMESLKQCPSEHNKYGQIGLIVFITGIMASLSGGFFFFSVFEATAAAIGFGLFWGLVIFFLDRYIVSSIHKPKGSELSLKVTAMAMPRFVLAIVLAFVVSKPLELKFFETEIKEQMQRDLGRYYDNVNSEMINSADTLIRDWQGKIDKWQSEINDRIAYRDQKQKAYEQERFGTKTESTSGWIGYGPEAKRREKIWLQAKDDADAIQKLNGQYIFNAQQEINTLKKQQDTERAKLVEARRERKGPLAKLEALHQLTSESSILWWANMFITLVFVLFECAPVLVKLLTPRGSYETIVENTKAYEETENEARQSVQNARLESHHNRYIEKIKKDGALYDLAQQKDFEDRKSGLNSTFKDIVGQFEHQNLVKLAE